MFKLIVADCAPSISSAIQAALPEAEFEIFPFSDGTEVIKSLDRIKPDVLLLNLFLKTRDGYDVCHFINSHDHFHKIPLFLLKGAFEPVDEERLSGLKYWEMIEEPFDSKILALKIREAVEGGDEPQILPEEPVFGGNPLPSSGSGRDVKDWLVEILGRNEDRIRQEVRSLVLDDVKELLKERGFAPAKPGEGADDKK
jgi:DNA-binding response OmpR family regulator